MPRNMSLLDDEIALLDVHFFSILICVHGPNNKSRVTAEERSHPNNMIWGEQAKSVSAHPSFPKEYSLTWTPRKHEDGGEMADEELEYGVIWTMDHSRDEMEKLFPTNYDVDNPPQQHEKERKISLFRGIEAALMDYGFVYTHRMLNFWYNRPFPVFKPKDLIILKNDEYDCAPIVEGAEAYRTRVYEHKPLQKRDSLPRAAKRKREGEA